MKSSKKKASTQSRSARPRRTASVKKSVKKSTTKKTKPFKEGGVEIPTLNKTVDTFEEQVKKIVFPKSIGKTEAEKAIERHNIDITELPKYIVDGIKDLILCIKKKGKTKREFHTADIVIRTQINDWAESKIQEHLDKGKKEAVPLEDKFPSYIHNWKQEDSVRKEADKYETSQKKYNEAIKVFKAQNIIKKDSRLPEYSLEFKNPTSKPLTCVLFGRNDNLLVKNLGSDKGIELTSSKKGVEYIQTLNQSADHPIKTRAIKIISENFNQLTQDINIKSKDANGEYEETPLSTKAYITNDVKRVLNIDYETVIDGNHSLSFTVLPKTSGSILFYNKNVPDEEKTPVKVISVTDMIILYNAIISCQIQQGLNFVSLKDVDKFTGSKAGSSIPVLDKIVEAGFIKTKQVNGEKQIGINLKMLTISGKTHTVNIKTAMQKSEYKVKK